MKKLHTSPSERKIYNRERERSRDRERQMRETERKGGRDKTPKKYIITQRLILILKMWLQ